MTNWRLSLLAGCSLATLFLTTAVYAQDSAESDVGSVGIGDIVVTAQKRSQSINDVGISITAATGETLTKMGVSSTADLARIVPGLTAQPSPFNTPVYTLRGVGFYDSTLAASPTVAVYTDEVPLPFSAMTKAAALDVAHVEVLKGPQGTLFGQNTTGGAINYIAAKPTDYFTAGADASFGRFSTADLQGFVSGPLSSTVNARLSLRTVQGGDWQKSFTRHDSLGATHQTQGRLLIDWTPTDRLTVSININGWKDESDAQAPQRWAAFISVPTATPERQALSSNYPLAPANARAADWGTDLAKPSRDDYFVQGAARLDYELADDVKLTSITAYERYKTNAFQDYDGTTYRIADVFSRGHINTFSQELRLSGKTGGLIWVLGGNYESDKTYDFLIYRARDSTTTDLGPLSFDSSTEDARQNIKTASVFGNVEYEVVPRLTVIGGLRYTDSRRSFVGCTNDANDGNASALPLFEYLQTVFRADGSYTPIAPGGCLTLGPAPDFATFPDKIHDKLNENNLSWRAGVNYKTENGLLYASVSKGYKAGSFPNTAASSSIQYLPVKQESLIAYEIGFKQSLFDRMLQLNGAAFYYDYTDKQLRGRVLDQVFGALDALVQIPKSRVEGAEIQAVLRPMAGLDLSVAATYLDTKIKKFFGYNQSGVLADYKGSAFPYAPEWTVVADGEYGWDLSPNLKAFVGSSLTYNSATTGSVGDQAELRIKAYTLIDLRAGITSSDESWRFQLWGRNITNSYYWTNATQTQDGYLRFAGRPVTYGATISYRLK